MLRAEKRLFKISLQRVITETFQNKILKIIQKLKVIIWNNIQEDVEIKLEIMKVQFLQLKLTY
jgi:hypothetical protein